jgi:UDP-N-acetylmuramoyl-L-alanyl-D-glutamate--2,6-diaminopimelate ligase
VSRATEAMAAPGGALPLDELFAGQALVGHGGDAGLPATVAGVTRDSRAVLPGQVYVACGRPEELAIHAAQARAAGAAAVVAARDPGARPWLACAHPRWSFARASAAALRLDRACPPLLAVTGTKGKSTTVHHAWWAAGRGAARIGTIGWHDGAHQRPNRQTTPPPEELHAFLARLGPGCPAVALEVSSHGADQHRLAGLRLRALAWTGLGHDHFDYHRTRAAYLAAKLRALRQLEPGGLFVVNADDPTAHVAAYAARVQGAEVVALGLGSARLPGGRPARIQRCGACWELVFAGAVHALPVALPGDFNAWNAAAGALLATAAGVTLEAACARLADLPPVPGRLERLAERPATYVDYAHTPESLALVIAALRAAHPGARLAVVFGCGGDRDPSKRAPMGAAAAAADALVVTADNSRGEDPAAIAAMVVRGLPPGLRVVDAGDLAATEAAAVPLATVELRRGEAIVLARRLAGPAGVVVVAGKGHETTQESAGVVAAWDDRAFVRALAASAASSDPASAAAPTRPAPPVESP